MEAVIFIGIQAAGKTMFYRERFSLTHAHINLDTLKTRSCEASLLARCLESGQPLVIDNTNVLAAERARYILPAKAAGYRVTGYYFSTTLQDALRRNDRRFGKERIRERGVAAKYFALQMPRHVEGFDSLFVVSIDEFGGFYVAGWREQAKPVIEEKEVLLII